VRAVSDGNRTVDRAELKLCLLIGAMEAMRDYLRDRKDADACTRVADALDVLIDQSLEDFPHLRELVAS
jgi:hypothetical protein